MQAVSTPEKSVNVYQTTRLDVTKVRYFNMLVGWKLGLLVRNIGRLIIWSVDIVLWYTLLLPHSLRVIYYRERLCRATG
jgi:hypothetical protein